MKLNQFFTFLCAACSLFLISCEEEFVPDTDASKQELVLEGYIESGEGANPTYVILTKSIPFVSTVDPNKFSELFVRGAKISVNDGDKNVPLTELCLADLPEELKREVYATLGFDPDSASVNICVYVDLFDQLKREQGRTYALTAEAEGKVLTATTTIPTFTGLYDFEWQDPPLATAPAPETPQSSPPFLSNDKNRQIRSLWLLHLLPPSFWVAMAVSWLLCNQ